MTTWFAKLNTEATDDHLFAATKKFEDNGYARCGNRIYRIVRVTPAGVPVLRLFGHVKRDGMIGEPYYEFHFSKQPKGRYAKDITGDVTMKNYKPCKRGPWWTAGVVASKV